MNENDSSNIKKQNTFLELLMGIGLTAVAYFLMWLSLGGNFPLTIKLLIDLIIMAAFIFLTVKFLRKEHKSAAIVMLVLISPGILGLLLFGACSTFFIPG